MVALDTETTGTDAFEARILSACLVRYRSGSTPEVRSWLVNPGVEIPADAAAVHGITSETVQRDGAPPTVVIEAVAEALVSTWRAGWPTVVMNAPYDLNVLASELHRNRRPGLTDRLVGDRMLVVDPLVIDRHVDRFRKGKRRLEDLCRVYGVTLNGAHTAEGDALAAVQVAWQMADRFPQELSDLNVLQELQAAWHREWADNFQSWLRENVDAAAEVDREWPLRPNRRGNV